MHVVATAGHVDHGKSTLVRALTGSDPDRLEEERRRGLTIELGYVWTTLPEVGEVAFVDVPGHERFIATTLAGVGPVSVAMLVVAADDPWMPQAAEHLAALDALGVRRGLLVVTRSDLADPGPAMAAARARLASTTLSEAPAVAVSAVTGQGLDELRRTLATVLADAPEPDPLADVRLWVDRLFTVRGAGTVVTGTLPVGTVSLGDTLTTGSGRSVRVRGLQALDESRTAVRSPARVALNLTGEGVADLARGRPLTTPDAYVATRTIDVEMSAELSSEAIADLPARPLLHVGTAMLEVRARPLGVGFVRLRLDEPLPLRVGDRLLLRDPGRRLVWGVDVVALDPPELTRRGAAALRVEELRDREGTPASELVRRGLVRRDELRRQGLEVSALPAGTIEVGDWLLAPDHAVHLGRRLVELVGTGAGLTPAEAARALAVDDPALVLAVLTAPLVLDRGRIVVPQPLSARTEDTLAGLRRVLTDRPFAAPDADTAADLGLDPASIAELRRAGRILHLGQGLVLLAGADDRAAERLATLPQPFSTSEARVALDTSRRVVLPLLAHLDRTGRTVRLADDRRRVIVRP